MAPDKLMRLLAFGLLLVLANDWVQSVSATRRSTVAPVTSPDISVNNTHLDTSDVKRISTGRTRNHRRRIKTRTTTSSSDILAITPSTLSVVLDTKNTLAPPKTRLASGTSKSESFVQPEKNANISGSATTLHKQPLAPALQSHGDARVHDTPMEFHDNYETKSEPEDAFYSYSERQSFDSLVADDPSFSSSEQYSRIPFATQHFTKLSGQPMKDYKRETPKEHSPAQTTHSAGKPERCQRIYKPMPAHARPGKKIMMTCYVCGKKDQPYVDGGYLEECNYSPTQRSNVYANYNAQSPYISSYRNTPYQGEATPQATSHSSSSASSGKGDKCKVYYKGHMKCTSCDDGSGAYSDQCDYEANAPGKHHQSSYDYGNQNGKSYGKNPSHGEGNGGSGGSGGSHDSGYGGGAGNGQGGYGDEDSYGADPYGDDYEGAGSPYASGSSNSKDGGYGEDDYYGPSYGGSDPYEYDSEDDSQPKSGSYSNDQKGNDAGSKDSSDNGKATTNNCHIVYKDMTSYSPYVKKGSKPKMKCMVCEGKDGVTEECNYSGGGGSPSASSDHAAFYSPSYLDDFPGYFL